MASNYDAAGEAIAINEQMAETGHEIHVILGKVMLITIGLHIVGALKHHIIDKDNTLKRLLGK